jgi:hypothetical protein
MFTSHIILSGFKCTVLPTHLFFIFFIWWGGALPPLGPFAGPLGSYESQYCGHILAYCTFSPDDT